LKKKILITGGSGFLAQEAFNFFNKNYDVILIDIIPLPNRNIRIIDITNYNKLNSFFKKHKPDIILHYASEIFDTKNKQLINKVNVLGTFNVLKSCEENRIRKLIFTSTFSIYEKNYNYLIKEYEPSSCENLYGISKCEAERVLLSASAFVDIVIFRCPVILEKTRSHRIAILFELLKNNMPLLIFGDGKNKIQFLSALDLFKATKKSFALKGKNIFNIGSEKVSSLKDTFDFLIKETQSKSKIIFINIFIGKILLNLLIFFKLINLNDYHKKLLISNVVMNIANIKKKLNFKPTITTSELLLDCYNFYILNTKKNGIGSAQKPKLGIINIFIFFYKKFLFNN
jgi:nucleoside-diphosphate-sugar epimerase